MAIQDLKVSMAYSGRDIASLSDRPNQDGMSASALKARFDQLNKEVIPNYNDLIDLLDTYIQTNDGDIVALENAINGLGISLGDLDLSVTEVLDAYNSGVLSGVYTGTTEPTDPRIKVWIDPDGQGIVIDETNRVNQEIVRQSNEGTRVTNENTRISNENTRISQESSRVNAENTRVTQENARNVFVDYNPLTPYVVGNKVSHNGSSYVCILDSLGNLPTNTTYWLLIAKKGDQGIQGEVTTAAMNTALANKADKLFATNLVTNGDFSNGTTGWTSTYGVGSVASNVYSHTGDGTNISPFFFQSHSIITGRKYYGKAVVKVTNSVCQNIRIRFGAGVGDINIPTPTQDTEYAKSIVFTSGITLTVGDAFTHTYADASTANGKVLQVKYVSLLDLTQIFGAGKEPTKEQMDWLLAQKYTNSWFDGTKELTSITDLLTLVDTKANITQETPIAPTFLNSWSDHSTGLNSAGYYKNSLGKLVLKGVIKGLTINTVAFILAIGYRPTKLTYVPVVSNGAFGYLSINTNGEVKPVAGNVAWFSLDGITIDLQ